MADAIDRAAEKFASAWEKVKNKSTQLYNTISNQNVSDTVKMVQISNLNLAGLILDDPELKKALAELGAEHLRVLKNMDSFAQVDDAYLSALIKIDEAVYIGATGASGADIKNLMGQSVTNRISAADFAKQLKTTGLQTHQANALASDSLRVYERNVTVEMAKNADPDKLFIWAGPLDSRTSPTCAEMIAAGEMTLAEWQSQYGAFIVSGVHVNDRHVLQPV